MSVDALKTRKLVRFMETKGLDQDNRGHVICAYMDVKGLEANDIAAKLGISRWSVYRYRSGYRRVPDSVLVELVKAFGVVE